MKLAARALCRRLHGAQARGDEELQERAAADARRDAARRVAAAARARFRRAGGDRVDRHGHPVSRRHELAAISPRCSPCSQSVCAGSCFSPYRMQRIFGFMDPWADPYGKGYQLSHALIAFGRGEWLGVAWAPAWKSCLPARGAYRFSAGRDRRGAGLRRCAAAIALFAWIVLRAFAIGRQARAARALLRGAGGAGHRLWIGVQALINMGVNMGVLPTKGLTLPLMSFGGSALLAQLRRARDPAADRLGESAAHARAARMSRTILITGGRHRRTCIPRARGSGSHARRRLARRLARREDRNGSAAGAARKATRWPGCALPRCAARACSRQLLLPLNLLVGFWQSARAILAHRPDVVLGLGGYYRASPAA